MNAFDHNGLDQDILREKWRIAALEWAKLNALPEKEAA